MTPKLDHVGVVVSNLDEGQEVFTRLGFDLTERGYHAGVTGPDGKLIPWGSGNHCAMFRTGYLEIIGVTDPSKPSSARDMLQKHQGTHIVALRTDRANAAYQQMSAATKGVRQPVVLSRQASFGPEGTEIREARFQNIYFDPQTFPEARWIVIEHETPEVLWQAHMLSHPNTALSIEEVRFAVGETNLDKTAERLATTFGATISDVGNGVRHIPLTWGRIVLVGAKKASSAIRLPGEIPCVTGFLIGVADLDTTRRVLAEGAVPFSDEGPDGLTVSAEWALGANITFASANVKT